MLWYVETATTKRAYADQELKSWDGIKGELPKAMVDSREQKLGAVGAAIFAEKAKGAIDARALPKAVTDRQAELRSALAAEVAAHVLPTLDRQKAKIVDVQLTAPTYACTWDGISPYVTTIIGTFPAKGIEIMGWPQTDVPPDLKAQ
jgi:hypothetical protein